jgi:hypothetical protein
MIDPASPKGNCPHCKSSKMEYYGSTLGGFHFYYKCSRCQKYVEYRITLKNFVIMSSIIFLAMVFSFVVPLSVLSDNSRLAILFFVGSVVLFSIVGYRYRWYFYESIPLEDLQTDLWIIYAASKKTRLLIVTILIAALLAYTGIFILNLTRQ